MRRAGIIFAIVVVAAMAACARTFVEVERVDSGPDVSPTPGDAFVPDAAIVADAGPNDAGSDADGGANPCERGGSGFSGAASA